MNLSCLFWVMCLVCIQFSDCVSRHTQLIWTLSVQEFVLFVLGDMLCVLHCIPMIICVSIKLVVPTTGVAPMTSQASREGGVVWQAGKA
jgi:hypothetical protein